jgi:hypothetical protein
MTMPDHTRRLAMQLLRRYCEEICRPPDARAVALGCRIDADTAVIHEKRRICGVEGSIREVPVARFQYDTRTGQWRLHHPHAYASDTPVRWRRYRDAQPTRNLAELLQILDTDPMGRFFPRINGASLRFCSARGRCADCARACRALLGISARPMPA